MGDGWHGTDSGRTFGKYGSCCAEMDIWEANRLDTAYTAHPCSVDGLYRCEGAGCDSQCDKAGCDFNSWRMGDHTFFGPGSEYTIDSSRPFTIVTQFITVDGTDSGDLSEIRRFYVQDGKRIENSKAKWEGLHNQTLLSDATCALDKQVFGEADAFKEYGGMKQMGQALRRGMTLVLSLWDDMDDHMHWLDSTEPADARPGAPGAERCPCSVMSGEPSEVRQKHGGAWVEYSNVKYGEIGTTLISSDQPTPAPNPPSPAVAPSTGGRCCWGKSCADGWCSKSREQCLGKCNGQWHPAAQKTADVPSPRAGPHRRLRAQKEIFLLQRHGELERREAASSAD